MLRELQEILFSLLLSKKGMNRMTVKFTSPEAKKDHCNQLVQLPAHVLVVELYQKLD